MIWLLNQYSKNHDLCEWFCWFGIAETSARMDFWWFCCGWKRKVGGNKDAFCLTCARGSWLLGCSRSGAFSFILFVSGAGKTTKSQAQRLSDKLEHKNHKQDCNAIFHSTSTMTTIEKCAISFLQCTDDFGFAKFIPNQDLIQINEILIFGMHPLGHCASRLNGRQDILYQ